MSPQLSHKNICERKKKSTTTKVNCQSWPQSTLADHVCHIRDKIGIDHVGIGGDYDGCTNLPVGLEDTGCYCGLTAELLRRGFGEDGVAKVLGGNVLRVWEAVEDVARTMVAGGALPSVARIEDLDTPVNE